jgi:hypothetical protein
LGLSLSRRDLDEVYKQMTALADRQKSISDADLLAIAGQVTAAATH